MSLIGRRPPHAHLRQSHHHFQHIHVADDVGQLGRAAPGDQARDVLARHIDIGQHARVIRRRQRHRFFGDIQIQRVGDDETVKRVKVGAAPAVQLKDAAGLNLDAGSRIIRAVGDDQSGFGPRLDVGLFVDVALRQQVKTFRTFHTVESTIPALQRKFNTCGGGCHISVVASRRSAGLESMYWRAGQSEIRRAQA